MQWHRRRDLEGGKELGVYLLVDETEDDEHDGQVANELYVESHEYRGGAFDVYTTDQQSGEWTHHGEFGTADAAFEAAMGVIEDSGHPMADDWG